MRRTAQLLCALSVCGMGGDPPAADSSNEPCFWFSSAMWAASRFSGLFQKLYGNYRAHGFGILMYHRIADRVPGVTRPTVNVTPTQFRTQLTGLLSCGFQAWSLSKLLRAHREGAIIPSNVFAVTFDDGYENNYLYAWPILRELRVPATILLATNYLNSNRPFPFDGWTAAGSEFVPASTWRPLSTRQCVEMLESGLIELGAHTHTHGRFLGQRDAFRRDLMQCLDVLRSRFNIDRPAFAFPYGDYSSELVDVALDLGVACCLTTRHRRVNPGDDLTLPGRFNVECSDTPTIVAAKLSGWRTALADIGKRSLRPFAPLVPHQPQTVSPAEGANWNRSDPRKAVSS